MDCIQLPHGGQNNESDQSMCSSWGRSGLPEIHLQPLGISSRCPTRFAAMRSLSGGHRGERVSLGGVEVDAAVHQLHIFFRKGVGGFVVTADEGNHVVTVVKLAPWAASHGARASRPVAVNSGKKSGQSHILPYWLSPGPSTADSASRSRLRSGTAPLIISPSRRGRQ